MKKKESKMLASNQEMTLREFASLGGKARAKALTAERRKEIASNAAKKRWKKDKISTT